MSDKKRIKAFYDSFLAEHGHEEPRDSIRVSLINLLMKSKINAKVLDAGCGTGSLTCFLAKTRPENFIVGTDFSEKSCKLAHARAKSLYECRFVVADLAFLPFGDSSFDFIILSEVIEHILPEERELVMKELRRVIAPSGCLFLTSPNGMHVFFLLRKFLDSVSKGCLRITDQIYDKPLPPHSLVRLLKISGWKIIFFLLDNYTFGLRYGKVRLARFPIFALHIFIQARPNGSLR